jgi:ComF family protein
MSAGKGKLVGLFRSAFDNLVALVFPNRCIMCDRPLAPSSRSPLCTQHAREILAVEPPMCTLCGRKMFGESVEGLVCRRCRAKRVYHDGGYSAYIFADPLREIIHLFKYGKKRYFRAFLGELVVDYLREHADMSGYDAIIPVPLHWRRYYSRGFNQAADLARPLSRHFGIPIVRACLRRVRYTRPQVLLSAEERSTNIKNAFRVTRPGKIAGKNLLLIDDVITSGSTLNECARVLKKSGASTVTLLTLAHPSDALPVGTQRTLLNGPFRA